MEEEEARMKINNIISRESELDKIFNLLMVAKTLQAIMHCEEMFKELEK